MKRPHSVLPTLVVVLALAGRAEAKVIVAPLTVHHPPLGFTYAQSDRTVSVSVTDERSDKSFIAAGLLGPDAEKGKGIYLAYATAKDEDLAPKADLRLAYDDNAFPKTSMKQVVEKALSRIYTLAAWQATAGTLVEAYNLSPGPEALEKLRVRVEAEKDEDQAREMIFWLGLSGKGSEVVKASLLNLFLKSKKQKVHEAASEAMGLLAIADASSDIHELLAGKKKIGDWDAEDAEQTWYLIHTLGMLGEKGLGSRVPTAKFRMATKVQDLVRFHETNQVPAASAVELPMAEKAKTELVKERK